MKYELSLKQPLATQEASRWLIIAVGFLLASGVYPLLLALARTTYEMPWKDFFYTALVLHVDFTVLWWLLGIGAMFYALTSSTNWKTTGKVSMLVVVLGGAFAAISPLAMDPNPLTNNYVPMLDENKYFRKGLIFLGFAICLMALRGVFTAQWKAMMQPTGEGVLRFGVWTAALATLLAVLALIWSFLLVSEELSGRAYFESLFWAGGHVLQFAHTALLMVCWLWLASACGLKIIGGPRLMMALFAIGAVSVLMMPYPFLTMNVMDAEFSQWFVWLMRDGNGAGPMILALLLMVGLSRRDASSEAPDYLLVGLLSSVLLFVFGGVLGWMIGESSTLITAHYHGAIVAVTMAFMTMSYYLLPRFGFDAPNAKWAAIQVYAYAIGQLIHIIGLAWGGGHGMQRKVVGTTQDLRIESFVTPQDLVGLGGVIAVLSGLLFAFVILPPLLRKRKNTEPADAV